MIKKAPLPFPCGTRQLLRLLLVVTLPVGVHAQFDFVTNNGKITITEYTGSDAAVIIPTRTNSLPIVRIGFGAFYNASLTSVTIPESIISIDAFAFQSCASLTNVTIANGLTTIEIWAFYQCTSLICVTLPKTVTRIRQGTFESCTSLRGVYFQGNAPRFDASVFRESPNATIFYLPGTTGWDQVFVDCPMVFWWLPYPVILAFPSTFGVLSNGFGFTISWATNADVVVEAGTSPSSMVWPPVATNTLTDGWSYFSDLDWVNYPERFYRLRVP